MNERLEKQMAFLLEIDKEKKIKRQTILSDGSRQENDAEHAWHMAIMTYLLSEYANEKIDVLKTMMMVLCHDLVEVYAGDTFAYDEAAKQSQQQREKKAADRLFGLLPEDQNQKIRSLWEEFEEAKTPESLFAHTMDNLQPTMLNAAAGGISWKEWGVHIDQILERNKLTGKGSKDLWNYSYSCLISPNVENGNIKK
ncbi:MAG: HD domain-containing protein [Erysipelotrichaceae bacterium]|nr:HD domain-containing protein [Erysipelotrichaceae bacterium]